MDEFSRWGRFKGFVAECLRVLKIIRKPDSFEFKTIVKVSGLGIIIIGFIGFILFMLKQLFFP